MTMLDSDERTASRLTEFGPNPFGNDPFGNNPFGAHPLDVEADGLVAEARHAARADRRRLRRDIAEASRTQRFEVQYQPRIALATGRPTGAEALLRWPHRRRGMVPPAVFVPLAEQSGQIVAIGGWALGAACAEAVAWPEPTIVSVNVSARQLAHTLLLDQVGLALEQSGLSPDRLELELTERLLIDVDVEMLLTLSAIRDLGVGLALDDFGTGFASLATLKRLPLTTLKLDRSLVREVPHDAEDAAIVRAAIVTGHALGLTVVAEGVETEAPRGFLAECGCDEGQGWLLGLPMPGLQVRGVLEGSEPPRPSASHPHPGFSP